MIPEKNSDKYVKQCELNLSRRVDLCPCMAFGHAQRTIMSKSEPQVPISTFSFAFDSHVFNMRFRINGDIWAWAQIWDPINSIPN